MRRGDEPTGGGSGVPGDLGGKRRGRFAAAARCLWAVAALWLATIAEAQSPFTQPPSSTGTFTLPLTPGAQSPFSRTPPRGGTFTLPQPGQRPTPTRPGEPSTAPPAPPSALPRLRGGEAPNVPGEYVPLPAPLPETTTPSQPHELPPAPAVAPPLSAASTEPTARAEPVLLRAGLTVTLRVCQVISADGLSAGERLLNSKPPIQPGDCFLAEVIDPPSPYPVLVGGTVSEITNPGRFGRPGYVSLRLAQLVQAGDGRTGPLPWRMDLADRRFSTRMRRVLLSALLGLEGAGTGASIGAQFSGGNMAFIGGGMGIGALVGLGYASFQRGTEANFEPGEMFEIVVGSAQSRPIPREWQTILFPAAEAQAGKVKRP